MNREGNPETVRPEEDRENEEQSEEYRVRMRRTEAVPSAREVEEHNVEHAMFRSWCPHCVKGRGEAFKHPRVGGREQEVPTISTDYMYVHPEEEKDEEREKGMPILIIKDDRKKVVMKSDNEPAIMLLKDLVRKETDVEIVMEESPVGDHQANGAAENAVKNVQGQFRALKDALEARLGARIQGEHAAVPWLIMHAGSVISRRRVDKEGFTPYRRWKGKPFNRPVAEFGENVWYLQANSAGENKYEVRWQEGAWLGVRLESGEAIIGTSKGVVKARDFRRKPENGGRWSKVDFDKFVGVPWELYPGVKGSTEMQCRVRLPRDPTEISRPVKGKDEYVPRRFRIQKSDLEKHGYTAGCPGCRAANRGLQATAHSEGCRARIQKELEAAGDERLERENARAFTYFGDKVEEEENRGKRARPDGARDAGTPATSSSSSQMQAGDVPRSRGGVPIPPDPPTCASNPESAKRRLTEEAQGEANEKKTETQEEERGAKRSTDEWEELAKRIRSSAQQKTDGGGTKTEADLDDMMQGLSAVLSEAKVDASVVAKELCAMTKEFEVEEEDYDENDIQEDMEQFADERTGEQLDPGRVREARQEELRELERRVYTVVDIKECWGKTGKSPIGVRWVDVHKGGGVHRSRLVAKDFRPKSRVGDVEGLFASMPPLELVKLIIAMAAEECRRGRTQKVMMIDIGKAHLYAPIEGEVFVELPPERAEEGKCAKLLFTLYGMMTAASSWEREYTKTLVEAGFIVGKANACTFFHPGREIRIVVHGDDFVVTGDELELRFVERLFKEKYPTKVRGVMGPSPNDAKELTILNRIVRWEGGEVSFEADPKHVEKMLEDMRLVDCKPNLVPGSREGRGEKSTALEKDRIGTYRSVVARANYLSQDRPDIRYATKELCRRMAGPTVKDWNDLKKLCRYLKGRPRMVQRRTEWSSRSGVIEVFVDSDWAGCPETRRSTSGGAILVHGMCLKTWSTTQRVVARSSGEAEALRGGAGSRGRTRRLEVYGARFRMELVRPDLDGQFGMPRHVREVWTWKNQTPRGRGPLAARCREVQKSRAGQGRRHREPSGPDDQALAASCS